MPSCGSSNRKGFDVDGGTGLIDGGACPFGSSGTLSIKIQGAPGNVGSVTIGGLAANQVLTTSMDVSLSASEYPVTAKRIAIAGNATVRDAYEPTVDVAAPCVHPGATTTVTVTYALIPSSGHVWAGNQSAGKEILGFTPASVAASGAPPAGVVAGTVGSDGFTFDDAGNLWVIGGTTADPPLARYAAATLATSGAKTPDRMISSSSFGSGIPGPRALAFDASGNLWVSVVAASKVVRFTPAQLAASGSPTAAVEIGGINAPAGIAFDQQGNLFVASSGDAAIVRVDKARLTASGTGADVKITADTPAPVIGPLPPPIGLAFDATGNLWVNFDGTLARLTPIDLLGTGARTITPAVQIAIDVQGLPEGIAFDELGGLWVAYSAGKLARYAATQLTASGAPPPSVVISSADIGYAGWFAIYPAPAATPLAHRLP